MSKVKKFLLFAAIAVLVGVICVLGFLVFKMYHAPAAPATGSNLVMSDAVDYTTDLNFNDNKEITAETHVFIEGFGNETVSAEDKIIFLSNVPENKDVYLTYQVVSEDTGKVLLTYEEVGKIIPGKAYEWNAYDVLESGENHVEITCINYNAETDEQGISPNTWISTINCIK